MVEPESRWGEMRRPVLLLLRFLAITALGVFGIGIVSSQLIPQMAKLPEAASFTPRTVLVLPELPEGSELLDATGAPLGKLQGSEYRIVVPLGEMSDELVDTILAVEDADFYDHDGVSVRSVLRALRANTAEGAVAQGGSTITQQLVKLTLVGNERSIERKIREASLALQLENQLCKDVPKRACKDRILQQYLNTIYFGQGAYGVEAAARTFFGKPASEVNLADAALLAALIRNPTNYDPIANPEVAAQRRTVALTRMVDVGLIDEDQAEFIDATPLPTTTADRTAAVDSESLSYVERKVRDELLRAEWLAPTQEQRRYLIFNGGLRVTTTIDPRAQQIADRAAESNPLEELNPTSFVALATVEPSTGAVRAIVGEASIPGRGIVEIGDPVPGPRSGDGGFSSGSAFKTIALVAMLDQGYSIRDTIASSPAPEALKDQWGVDTAGAYPSGCGTSGQGTLAGHLASSNNCAFMRMQSVVGFEAVRNTAIKLGLSAEPLDPDEVQPACFTIGCDALVKPLDMAVAYATIANDGRRNPAHFVQRVEDRDGNVLWEYEPVNEQVIPVQVARQATEALTGVITGGTCTRCALPRRQPAAGKTGTTEIGGGANVGVWFVGYTPHASTAVWIGDPVDQRSGMRGSGVQGGRSAGVVWRDFMAEYLQDAPVIGFLGPERTSSARSVPDPWRDAARGSSTRRPR